MLTNKDRKQNKHVPYSYPIAYAMKGSSMSNADLQYMVSKLRNVFQEKQISVLCEAYDGQWHNHITQTKSGEHLTKMHCRGTWSRICRLSKDKCIEELSNYCIIKSAQRNLILQLNRGFIAFTADNIKLKQNGVGKLTISTQSMKMSQIISVTQKSRPNLFEEGVSVYSSSVEETTVPRRKKTKSSIRFG